MATIEKIKKAGSDNYLLVVDLSPEEAEDFSSGSPDHEHGNFITRQIPVYVSLGREITEVLRGAKAEEEAAPQGFCPDTKVQPSGVARVRTQAKTRTCTACGGPFVKGTARNGEWYCARCWTDDRNGCRTSVTPQTSAYLWRVS